MTLVDVPMVSAGDRARGHRRVAAATGAPIVRPAIGERHGHPVLFDRAVFAELRARAARRGRQGGRARASRTRFVNVAVDDEGCLTDIDTPDDYAAFVERSRKT